MSVLVIGASGFIGAGIAARLADAEHDVLCLSRRGLAPAGRGLRGDVQQPGLGLEDPDGMRDEVTHIVSCFGSVDWDAGPVLAEAVHGRGTRNVLEFASTCPSLERLVHVSSVLQFGRASGLLTNRDRDVGQEFRTWYEYGKFRAEQVLWDDWDVPRRAIRFGPVLGTDSPVLPSAKHGMLAVIPYLLRGYPVPLVDRGDYPSYVCDVTTAAEVVRRALEAGDDAGDTWTWFDPARQSVADVLVAVCSAWGTMPRIVGAPKAVRRLANFVAPPLGMAEPLLEYTEPWFDIDPAVLDDIPGDAPEASPGYLESTGTVLRGRAAELMAA